MNTQTPTAGATRRIPVLVAAIVAATVLSVSAACIPAGARPARASAVGGPFGYPVKPFDREHAIRGYFGDPRTIFLDPPTTSSVLAGRGSFSFHQGVDISAPDGTAVYPVRSGTVTTVTPTWVRVASAGGSERFEYWHIRPAVRVGQAVTEDATILGRILKPAGHVHLTVYEGGRVVNPLARGRLEPFHDTTRPVVSSISLRRGDAGPEVFPSFVRGPVELVVDASDMPSMRVRGEWTDLPVTPALLTWRIQSWTGKVVLRERAAYDHRVTVPANAAFWATYARGTYQNMAVFGPHYSYLQRGRYLFRLTPKPFDTETLHDGVYDLIVTATDMRGNRGSASLRFTVHNRSGWIGS
jgi:hypothetical protein